MEAQRDFQWSEFMMNLGKIRQQLSVIFIVPLLVFFLVSCAETGRHRSALPVSAAESKVMPEQAWSPYPAPASAARSDASSITKIVVPSRKTRPHAIYRQTQPLLQVSMPDFEIPVTGAGGGKKSVWAPGPAGVEEFGSTDPEPESWVGVETGFISTDFDDNGTYTGGYRFIPPDSHAAAGSNHLVNVVNTTITFHQKDGTNDFQDSLKTFFSGLNPLTFTFDPKVLYDQYEDRWVVITMERTAVAEGDAADTSRMFVAVSDDSDPNGTWYFSEFDTVVNISGADHWADYPGFAVDEEAVYITTNLFSFAGSWGGVRVWILDKGVGAGGIYDTGGSLAVAEIDPYLLFPSCCDTTTQPSHMFGPTPAGLGTFLVSYSGINDGTNEYIQVLRLDDPLGTPVFTQTFISLGNIDGLVGGLPDMPQLGTNTLIESNDRRALDAVWRDNALWLTATTNPNSEPDIGESTALWVKIDTTSLAGLSLADFGMIGGEDIAAGTYTTFPSIAVNADEDVVVGFSASAPSIYAGAYFADRQASDPAGFMGSSVVVQAGLDSYVRTFGGSRNRWGDYSATAVDPVDDCFWVYNQWADVEGTDISGELGRWGTAYAKTCPISTPVSCDGTYDIAANTWTKFALPCSVAPNDTVANIFDLLPADYESTWVVYSRDSATPEYLLLNTGSPMVVGNGYWVYSTTGTQVNISGSPAAINDIDLVGVYPEGRDNYVGHNQNVSVDWNLVEVVDGDVVLGIDEYDKSRGGNYDCDVPVRKSCVMSRIMQKWNGSAYQPYDGNVATGTVGSLDPFDAFWVQAFKPGIKLRIPVGAATGANVTLESSSVESFSSTEGQTDKKPKKPKNTSWHIRLIATSGDMEDPGNVFGQLETGTEGNDPHDLEELAPFGSKYLSVLFTNPLFSEVSWGFTTDFRGLTKNPQGVWPFVVKAHAGIQEVTIRWEGDDYLFKDAWLVDEQSGEMMNVKAGESYTFDIFDGERHFRFELGDG